MRCMAYSLFLGRGLLGGSLFGSWLLGRSLLGWCLLGSLIDKKKNQNNETKEIILDRRECLQKLTVFFLAGAFLVVAFLAGALALGAAYENKQKGLVRK